MTVTDLVTVLEAVGDSWPAAIIVVAGILGFVAIRALPRLKEIVDGMRVLRHELKPNSGKTIRDAVDRLEKSQATQTQILAQQTTLLTEHISEDKEWKSQVEDLLTRNEGNDDPTDRHIPTS